ncbi:hypothetical protein L0128_12375 [candidate division KSB1 bacterium]|nr:hypothetical protein [candidate division KSB1 bacterium]
MDTNETTSKNMDQPVTRAEHKKDLDALKNELLAKLVTKEEYQKGIANLVTKEEYQKGIANLVTKEEYQKGIANLVTKEEHKKDIDTVNKKLDNLTNKVAQNSADIIELKQQMAGVPEKINQILKIVDGLMKFITDGQVEKVAQEATFRRHEKILSDHEVRLGQLEKKCA